MLLMQPTIAMPPIGNWDLSGFPGKNLLSDPMIKLELMRKMFRFGLWGVVGAGIFTVLNWLFSHWMNPDLACFTPYPLAAALHFYLNKWGTFKSKGGGALQAGFRIFGADTCSFFHPNRGFQATNISGIGAALDLLRGRDRGSNELFICGAEPARVYCADSNRFRA